MNGWIVAYCVGVTAVLIIGVLVAAHAAATGRVDPTEALSRSEWWTYVQVVVMAAWLWPAVVPAVAVFGGWRVMVRGFERGIRRRQRKGVAGHGS